MSEKIIGYARTASASQSADSQIETLKQAGCTEIFSDVGVSGNALDRPGLHQARAALKPGDTLMVCGIDRLTRNIGHHHTLLRDLARDGIEFKSLADTGEREATWSA